MKDRKLANAIERENQAEAVGSLSAADRTTCYPHQSRSESCATQHTPNGTGRGMDERLDLDYIRGNRH
ncbi:hypothetical protein ACODT4_44400 [Streptomyces sp. 2.9]|uniref:hypothetical protein n=1 Tax=Streptomyces tritrimontium TaxID=3406573 RepID=UPI003BB5E798